MQLCRNNPNIKEIALLQDLQIHPPPLPEWTTQRRHYVPSLLTLSWQAAGRSTVVNTRNNFTHNLHIHASLGEATSRLNNGWACMRHVTIVSNSCQILFGPITPMQQSSHMFPTHMTQFRILFNGSPSFLAMLSSVYSWQETKEVYTYAIRLPRQAVVVIVEDGSPASCRQTSMVTTIL